MAKRDKQFKQLSDLELKLYYLSINFAEELGKKYGTPFFAGMEVLVDKHGIISDAVKSISIDSIARLNEATLYIKPNGRIYFEKMRKNKEFMYYLTNRNDEMIKLIDQH